MQPEEIVETKVYKFRWYVLLVAFFAGFSAQMELLTYSPVANFADEFYGSGSTNMLTIAFMATVVIMSVLAMYLAQRFGLRWAILLGVWPGSIGSAIRILSTISSMGTIGRKVWKTTVKF